jgi:hypothetical protein
MPFFLAVVAAVVISVLGLLSFAAWGIPIAVVAMGAAALYIAVARKRDPSVGAIERGKPIEPTGRPRKGTGGAEPTNERIGA